MKCSLFLSSVILFLLLQIYYKAWYFCWNYPFFLSTRALYFCNFLVHCRVLNSQLWSFNQNFHCFKGVVQCQISFLWHFLVSSYKWYSSKFCNRKYAFFFIVLVFYLYCDFLCHQAYWNPNQFTLHIFWVIFNIKWLKMKKYILQEILIWFYFKMCLIF